MNKFLTIAAILAFALTCQFAEAAKRRYITPEEVHQTISAAQLRKADELYESVKTDYSRGKLTADGVVDKALYHKTWSPELAARCLQLVADKSNRAKAELGFLYTYFKTAYRFPNKSDEGVRLMEAAAQAGNKRAADYLGIYYNNKKDYNKSRKYFEVAGPDNIPFALTVIGEMYDKGNGYKKDRAKAREYYGRAAVLGDASGAAKYGSALQRQWYGKVNMPDAFFWTYLAGELGDDFSRSNLRLPIRGERYGDDVQTAFVRNSLTLGEAWNDQYEHAIQAEPIYQEGYKVGLVPRTVQAEKGDPWSLFYLGSMSYNDEFLNRQDEFVTKCYEPILSIGQLPDNAMALVYERLGEIYRQGKGVKANPAKAAEYTRKAANLGSLAAYKIVESIPD